MISLIDVLLFFLLSSAYSQDSDPAQVTQITGKLQGAPDYNAHLPFDEIHLRNRFEKSLVSVSQHFRHLCCGALLNSKAILLTTSCVNRFRYRTKTLVTVGVADNHTEAIAIITVLNFPDEARLSIAILQKAVQMSEHVSTIPLPLGVLTARPLDGASVGVNEDNFYQVEHVRHISIYGSYYYAPINDPFDQIDIDIYAGRLLFFEEQLIGIAETVVDGLIEPNHRIEGHNVLYIRIFDKLRHISRFAHTCTRSYAQNNNSSKRSRLTNESSCKDEEHRISKNNKAGDILRSHEKGSTSLVQERGNISPSPDKGITSPRHGEANTPPRHGNKDTLRSNESHGDDSPNNEMANHSQNHQIETTPSSQESGNISLQHQEHNITPNQRVNDPLPSHGKNITSPSDDTSRTLPNDRIGNISPQHKMGITSPSHEISSASPSHGMSNTSPGHGKDNT